MKKRYKIIFLVFFASVVFLGILFCFVNVSRQNGRIVQTISYYLDVDLDANDTKLLGLVSSLEEFNELSREYGINSRTDFDFKNHNYVYVIIRHDSCGEEIKFENISNKNIYFTINNTCGGCLIVTELFEIEVSKDISVINDVKYHFKGKYCNYDTVKKPVLYLYPEENMNVNITFEHSESLLTTYPKYKNEWNVFAKTDGTLIDSSGRSYYALYWDEKSTHKEKFKTGFYVKGEDSVQFLEEKLFEIGLTEREANEFIMYWLPIMEENGDNLVHFDLTAAREEQNKINIKPEPDSLLRFSIEIKKVKNKVSIKEQKLSHFDRNGFVVVEWGGVVYDS